MSRKESPQDARRFSTLIAAPRIRTAAEIECDRWTEQRVLMEAQRAARMARVDSA